VTKLIAVLGCLFASLWIGYLSMTLAWGLEVKNWWAFFGLGIVANLFIHLIGNKVMSEK
jgi:hypothetical protein